MKVLLIKEFKWNWRSFRYPAFLLIVLFFALLDPLMMKYMNEIIGYFAEGLEITMPDPTPQDAFVSYLSDVAQIGLFVLIFMIMGSVAREKESGVTGWMLSKPISRWQYLAAKLIVHYAVITAGLLACSALAYLYTMSLLGAIPLADALLGTLALITYTLFIATITFALSTVLKSPLQAGGLSLGIFFLTGILNLFISKSALADFYPNTLLAQLKPIVDGTAGFTDIAGALSVTLALIAILIALSGTRFTRMEL